MWTPGQQRQNHVSPERNRDTRAGQARHQNVTGTPSTDQHSADAGTENCSLTPGIQTRRQIWCKREEEETQSGTTRAPIPFPQLVHPPQRCRACGRSLGETERSQQLQYHRACLRCHVCCAPLPPPSHPSAVPPGPLYCLLHLLAAPASDQPQPQSQSRQVQSEAPQQVAPSPQQQQPPPPSDTGGEKREEDEPRPRRSTVVESDPARPAQQSAADKPAEDPPRTEVPSEPAFSQQPPPLPPLPPPTAPPSLPPLSPDAPAPTAASADASAPVPVPEAAVVSAVSKSGSTSSSESASAASAYTSAPAPASSTSTGGASSSSASSSSSIGYLSVPAPKPGQTQAAGVASPPSAASFLPRTPSTSPRAEPLTVCEHSPENQSGGGGGETPVQSRSDQRLQMLNESARASPPGSPAPESPSRSRSTKRFSLLLDIFSSSSSSSSAEGGGGSSEKGSTGGTGTVRAAGSPHRSNRLSMFLEGFLSPRSSASASGHDTPPSSPAASSALFGTSTSTSTSTPASGSGTRNRILDAFRSSRSGSSSGGGSLVTGSSSNSGGGGRERRHGREASVGQETSEGEEERRRQKKEKKERKEKGPVALLGSLIPSGLRQRRHSTPTSSSAPASSTNSATRAQDSPQPHARPNIEDERSEGDSEATASSGTGTSASTGSVIEHPDPAESSSAPLPTIVHDHASSSSSSSSSSVRHSSHSSGSRLHRDRDRRHSHERSREREKERDKSKEQERKKERDNSKEREREKEKERDRSKEREREKERDRSKEREREKQERSRERERPRSSQREWSRERDRDRSREETKRHSRDASASGAAAARITTGSFLPVPRSSSGSFSSPAASASSSPATAPALPSFSSSSVLRGPGTTDGRSPRDGWESPRSSSRRATSSFYSSSSHATTTTTTAATQSGSGTSGYKEREEARKLRSARAAEKASREQEGSPHRANAASGPTSPHRRAHSIAYGTLPPSFTMDPPSSSSSSSSTSPAQTSALFGRSPLHTHAHTHSLSLSSTPPAVSPASGSSPGHPTRDWRHALTGSPLSPMDGRGRSSSIEEPAPGSSRPFASTFLSLRPSRHRGAAAPTTVPAPSQTPPPQRTRPARPALTPEQQLVLAQAIVRGWLARRAYRKFVRKKRVVEEMWSSEQVYVEKLQFVVELLLKPLTRAGEALASADEVRTIFCNVEALLAHHRRFLTALSRKVARWHAEDVVGDVFLAPDADMVALYQAFTAQKPLSRSTLSALRRTRPELDRWLRAREAPDSLESLLILPVQRITRYVLLLNEALRATGPRDPDRELLAQAIERMRLACDEVNDTRQADAEEVRRVDQIVAMAKRFERAQLQGPLQELWANPTRRFLREASVLELERDMRRLADRHLFLLSDLVLVAAPATPSPTGPLLLLRFHMLSALNLSALSSDSRSVFARVAPARLAQAFELSTSDGRRFVFVARSDQERERLYRDLEAAILATASSASSSQDREQDWF